MVKNYNTNHWVYDIETYPNIFTFCCVRSDGKHLRVFEISDRKNETDELLTCLRWMIQNRVSLVGYNNVGFDYPIIHDMINVAVKNKRKWNKTKFNVDDIYQLAQQQIESGKDGGFSRTIKTNDSYIRQIDLYKIHHFDNKNKRTSLKTLEFNMRSDNVEDLPFPVGTTLDDSQKDVLIKYNKHDVLQTLEFYYHTFNAIKFREELTSRYGMDCTNSNDTKIGKDYFIQQLEKAIPGSCYIKQGNRRHVKQTKRDFIDIGECLFDYYDFERPEFITIKDWFSRQRITETKGIFSDVEEHMLGEVAKYATMRVKRKKCFSKPNDAQIKSFLDIHPCGWVSEHELKSGKDKKSYWTNWRVSGKVKEDGKNEKGPLNVVVNGFQFDFGVGGIHGSIESEVVHSDEEYIIMDADVTSMYPSLSIANNVYPHHLSRKFCDVYLDVFNTRKKYPKKEFPAENALFKLALNGVYGDSNSEYSPLYDPAYTMTITVNGQLSLCLLSEKLMNIEGLRLIQVNTDGVTVRLPRSRLDDYYATTKAWEEKTGLGLEYTEYKSMFIRDVNNYIAVTSSGKIKRKGAYCYETPLDNPDTQELGWHKDHGGVIIAKAAEAVMVKGENLEEFVRNHKVMYDFMLRAKVPRSSRLELETDDGSVKLQNLTRYYVTNDGGNLFKFMPATEKQVREGKTDDRKIGIDTGWKVSVCNDVKDFDWGRVNYDYYISKAKDLILIG